MFTGFLGVCRTLSWFLCCFPSAGPEVRLDKVLRGAAGATEAGLIKPPELLLFLHEEAIQAPLLELPLPSHPSKAGISWLLCLSEARSQTWIITFGEGCGQLFSLSTRIQ